MIPPRTSRTQLSFLCALFAFISLWNIACCLEFGILRNNKLVKRIPISTLLESDESDAIITDALKQETFSPYLKPLFPKPHIEAKNEKTTNNTTPAPEKKEDTTFNPDTVLFGADDVINSAVPIEIDPAKLIPMDKAEEVSGRLKPEIAPLNVTLILPSSEPLAPLPDHILSKNPEAIDAVSRKLFDREDVQPRANPTDVEIAQ